MHCRNQRPQSHLYILISLMTIFLNCLTVSGCRGVKGKVEYVPEDTASLIVTPGNKVTIYDLRENDEYELYHNPYGFIEGVDYLPCTKSIVLAETRFRALNDRGEYTVDPDVRDYLKLVSINRGTVEILFEGKAERPAVSPDERSIAFYADGKLFVLDINSHVHRILSSEATKALGYKMSPSWSPDGNRIVFITADKYAAIIASSGGELRKLRKADSCKWSPVDEDRIFVSEYSGGSSNYYLINTMGEVVIDFTDTFKRHFSYPWTYSWSRDGKQIFIIVRYEMFGGDFMNVWQLNMQTKEARRILKGAVFSGDVIQVPKVVRARQR
jgi:WD40 repeat protein